MKLATLAVLFAVAAQAATVTTATVTTSPNPLYITDHPAYALIAFPCAQTSNESDVLAQCVTAGLASATAKATAASGSASIVTATATTQSFTQSGSYPAGFTSFTALAGFADFATIDGYTGVVHSLYSVFTTGQQFASLAITGFQGDTGVTSFSPTDFSVSSFVTAGETFGYGAYLSEVSQWPMDANFIGSSGSVSLVFKGFTDSSGTMLTSRDVAPTPESGTAELVFCALTLLTVGRPIARRWGARKVAATATQRA